MGQKFFISFNANDRGKAEWIAWVLREAGHEVAIHTWELSAGDNIPLWMNERLAWADRLIAVVSPDYVEAAYSAMEWAQSVWGDPGGRDGKTIPVVVRATELPALLSTLRRIDLTGVDEAEARRRLLDGISQPAPPVVRPRFQPAPPTTPEQGPLAKPAFVAESQGTSFVSKVILGVVTGVITGIVLWMLLPDKSEDKAVVRERGLGVYEPTNGAFTLYYPRSLGFVDEYASQQVVAVGPMGKTLIGQGEAVPDFVEGFLLSDWRYEDNGMVARFFPHTEPLFENVLAVYEDEDLLSITELVERRQLDASTRLNFIYRTRPQWYLSWIDFTFYNAVKLEVVDDVAFVVLASMTDEHWKHHADEWKEALDSSRLNYDKAIAFLDSKAEEVPSPYLTREIREATSRISEASYDVTELDGAYRMKYLFGDQDDDGVNVNIEKSDSRGQTVHTSEAKLMWNTLRWDNARPREGVTSYNDEFALAGQVHPMRCYVWESTLKGTDFEHTVCYADIFKTMAVLTSLRSTDGEETYQKRQLFNIRFTD